MRQRAVSRRAVLRGTAAGAVAAAVAGCSTGQNGHGGTAPSGPATPDPETVLVTKVIADKERIVALYRQAAAPGSKAAAVLLPFQRRHEAHIAELRRRLPRSPMPATPTPSGPTPSPTGSASPGKISIGRLREAERKAAATRPRQIGDVSPALAQLLACIGACEAAHAAALARVS
ncbi:hypothetical protein AB0M95_33865 [Sphaerisporangium sp. NPDC051017]|uniref:hypothetical protein n=1 Tax=Sphaerisporangium sp. NPDC051017 TaxID=3154636 RepID=UPI003413073A